MITYQSRNPGIGPGVHRAAETWLFFAALVGACVLAGDPREYKPAQWIVLACFATVLGIFVHHSLSAAKVSVRSRHPVWAGVVMGVGLVVLPQYVRTDQLLWALSRVSAAVVLVGLPVYVVGEYILFGLDIGFQDSYMVPVVEYRVRAARSVFYKGNAFATVVLPGLIAAIAEVHRLVREDRHVSGVLLPGILLGINALGLAISFGRALWVITPMAIGIYVAYLVDRRLIPVAVVGAFAYLFAGIYLVQSGVITIPVGWSTRAERWYPAFAAIWDTPSWVGAGLVDPGQFVTDYYPNDSTASPHNSYLSIWIRAGFLGLVAYLLLVGTGLVSGIRRFRDVDVAVLVIAVVFASHQLFEA